MKAKCLIINCMDPRVQEGVIKLTQKKNCFGEYYLISNKGSSKHFLNGRETDLLEMIEAAEVNTVIIIHHSKCKEYDTIAPAEEKEVQIQDMKKTKLLIRNNFPNIRVIMLWAELNEFEEKVASFKEISN